MTGSFITDSLKIPSAARWLSAIALGAFVLGGSMAFMSRNAPAVVSAAIVKPVTSTKRVPSYIARIEPIAAGSISAITPLPKATPVAQTIASTAAAPLDPPEDPNESNTFRVAADGLNVRRDASSRSARIGSVRAGAIVTMLAREGQWMLVDAGDMEGWVFGKYLEPVDQAAIAALD